VDNMDTLLSKTIFCHRRKTQNREYFFHSNELRTADSLCKEILNAAGVRLKYFNGYEVLLSESLNSVNLE